MESTNNRRSNVRLSVGSSSIVVIFVILTLTTFATLSLVSANADNTLSKKNVEMSLQYYEADAAAEDMLAAIDGQLQTISASGSAFLPQAESLAGGLDGVTAYTEDGGLFLAYAVPVNEVQQLEVVLKVEPDPAIRYTRQQWAIVSTVEDEQEDDVELMQFDD
ncbi:hypothetical protein LJC63_02700 [Ruminococcaceae bacterium OttesenSCG-928-L11]|nr:hypothetical protein [Ruminococcaceae bacterium OttesenSCG-928-L11]